MAALRNIIFDLGGVLLDIDYRKTEEAFKALGFSDFEKMYSQFTADELFADLEKGKISEEDFYKKLTEAGAGAVSKESIRAAWNEMLLQWREKSLAFVKQLSTQYQTYLLSNTNAIHLAAFNKILKNQTGETNGINHLFTKAYYSHEVNLRKPTEDIFRFVASDAGIIPAETLFIDDSFNNIETAAGLGFKTHLLKAGETIESLDYSKF